MLKNMPKLAVVLIIVVITAWTGVLVPEALAQRARVPQTGQTTSYAPGDDGDIQAGVEWPSPRFTNRRNGTVRDNLTGLIWLRDASCDVLGQNGAGTWQQALDAANALASGRCGLTDGSAAGDWHLPNVRELLSLIDFGTFNPALPTGHQFSDVRSASYWSSTTSFSPEVAWQVSLDTGSTGEVIKSNTCVVWPVRGGD